MLLLQVQPRIDYIDPTVSKALHISGRNRRSSRPSYRCDLAVGLADWMADCAAAYRNGGIGAGGLTVE